MVNFHAMLQTNELVLSLHNYLLSSGSYDFDEDAGASDRIFAEWNDRLLTALQEDFKQHAQVSLQFSDAFFELFGDRGETVWGVRATTVVDESEPGLSFWVKCIIGHQQAKAYLTEDGKSAQTDHLFPVEPDHLNPEQTDHLIPEQTDHPLKPHL